MYPSIFNTGEVDTMLNDNQIDVSTLPLTLMDQPYVNWLLNLIFFHLKKIQVL